MKSIPRPLLLTTAFLGMLFSAHSAVKETDWCTIETPDSAQAGDRVEVKVTLKKELPADNVLQVNMHWFKKDAWGGSMGANYVPPKAPAPVGKPTVFSVVTSKKFPDLDRWSAFVFAAPDGDYKRLTLKANGAPIMKGAGKAPAAKPAAPAPAAEAAGGITKTELDWATIESPAFAMPGQRVTIRVTLKKEVPANNQVKIDMHWFKKDGWGGAAGSNYVPPRNPSSVGTPMEFTFVMGQNLEDLDRWSPLVYAAPGGDFNKKTLSGNGTPIKFDASADPERAKRLAANQRPATCLYKKSWIEILPCETKEVRSGDTFIMRVKYYLDPTESWGDGTKLTLQPLGPWIDNPDGTYVTRRQHMGYPGLGNQTIKGVVGKVEIAEFKQKFSKTFENNGLAYRAFFTGADNKQFPWEIRSGSPHIIADVHGFAIRNHEDGGLFVEPKAPELFLAWGKNPPAGAATFTIYDSEGKTVTSFTRELTPGVEGSETPLSIPALNRRGVFLIEASVNGEVVCGKYFGIIPDVLAALKGKKTPFGCTNVSSPSAAKTAQKLGMSYCRLFTSWRGLEPLPGDWRFDNIDRTVDRLNACGIRPWICLINPPEWIMPPGVHAPHFMPFPVNEEAWAKSARALAEHFKGRIWGFEWDNELVMGDKTPTPVEDYLKFVRIGTQQARAVDPNMRFQVAGGLWPRNFRLDLIRAGLCEWIDVAPVHYSSYGGIQEIRDDMAAGGGAIPWDNETAKGFSIWGKMPRLHGLVKSAEIQSKWVMRQWPGELLAGAEGIVYFGGEGDAAGNWSYLIDPYTPRPVAASLATLAVKLGRARPVAALYTQPGSIVYLFEREDGKGVASVMAASESESVTVRLPVGKTPSITVTDYCGNETTLAARDGFVELEAKPMPVILEGFDLAPLALQGSLAIAGQNALTPKPTVRIVEGSHTQIKATMANPLTVPVSGSLAISIGDATIGKKTFSLKPGENTYLVFESDLALSGDAKGLASMEWTGATPAKAATPFDVATIRLNTLGNLLKNGDFEEGGAKPAVWTGNATREALPEGGHALAFDKSEGYSHESQTITLPVPGATYLYTAWVKCDNMLAGSNVSLNGDGIKGRNLYTPAVFTAPNSTDGAWVYLLKKLETNPGETKASFTPIAKGANGYARFDNVRVTLFEGSEYMAEASKVDTAPAIDGNLADWGAFKGPIPLHCANLVSKTGAYKWSPENVAGQAAFAWDKEALYLAVRVTDDKHVTFPNENCGKGDSVILALHPGNRAPGTDGLAMEWVLSSAHPGGGSGSYTLWRPAEHSAGRKAEHLAKDSSNYGIAIKTSGTDRKSVV